jgi:ribosome maturation factor RimP
VAQVNLFAPQDGRRKFSGPILGADETTVRIEQDGAEVTLDLSNVVKARLVPDYDKILAGHKMK